VVMCGRRFGKTTMGEMLACEPALLGDPIGWFAPTYKYLLEPWGNLCRTLKPAIARVSAQEKRIELVTGGVIDFWTLEDNDAGRGRKYKRIIVDEASLVANLEECWTMAIRPTLSDYRGDAWFFMTPKGKRYAYRLFLRGQDGTDKDWRSWRVGTIDNPVIDPAEIESARSDMPASVFAQEYEGIPQDDAGNPFGADHILACTGAISDEEPVLYGVDLARSIDHTVVIGIDQHRRVCRFERWRGVPWAETKDRILRIVKGVRTYADSTGVGDGIVEDLSRVANNIVGFKFTAESKQHLMEALAVAIQSHGTRFPPGPITSELEWFEYQYRGNGSVRYSAPEGMHDDCVCALALAVYHMPGMENIGATSFVPGAYDRRAEVPDGEPDIAPSIAAFLRGE